ncbi:MAG: paraquat-inducible protein A [Kiloniellaceae bacterium]
MSSLLQPFLRRGLRLFAAPGTLAAESRGPDRLLGLLLLAAAAALAAGWMLPVMTVRTMFFFYDEVSILTGMLRLLDSGDHALFAVILLFTVVLPVAKLAVAWFAWSHLRVDDPRVRRLLGWIEAVGRWSMLDVFVAAMVVVVIKLSLVSDVEVHAGLYVFIAAVVLSMLAVRRIAALAHRRLAGDAPPRLDEVG